MWPKELKFLIVDDAATVRSLLKDCLRQQGFKNFAEAEDGADGLKKLEAALADGHPFGFVFCDMNMPNMSGLELLEICGQHADFKKTPFVMVTTEAEQAHVLQAIALGVSDYLLKPFTLDSVKVKLDRVYQKRHPKTN